LSTLGRHAAICLVHHENLILLAASPVNADLRYCNFVLLFCESSWEIILFHLT